VFAVSRFMGSSIAMIDRHDGHLAQRQPRTRSRPPRRARARTGRGRCVDVAPAAGEAAQHHDSEASRKNAAAARGRPVDAVPRFCRLARRRKELTSRNFLKPSRGLEPRTPSLPGTPTCPQDLAPNPRPSLSPQLATGSAADKICRGEADSPRVPAVGRVGVPSVLPRSRLVAS
jgi:hypothetical protein